MAHGPWEAGLHPDAFKTNLCAYGKGCQRRMCFFAHDGCELRSPQPGASQLLMQQPAMQGPTSWSSHGQSHQSQHQHQQQQQHHQQHHHHHQHQQHQVYGGMLTVCAPLPFVHSLWTFVCMCACVCNCECFCVYVCIWASCVCVFVRALACLQSTFVCRCKRVDGCGICVNMLWGCVWIVFVFVYVCVFAFVCVPAELGRIRMGMCVRVCVARRGW